MIRGTDTQFKFNMPCPCSDLAYVTISFWQPENKGPSTDRPLPIIKVLGQCLVTDTQISVVLSREETLRFSDKRKAYVQLRATKKNGLTMAIKKQQFTVYPIQDESLTDGLITPTPTNDYIYFDGDEISNGSNVTPINMDGNIVVSKEAIFDGQY